MGRSPRIGFLPLYLKLYDDAMPEKRTEFTSLLERTADGFQSRGIEVVRSDVCRVADEFDAAVALFGKNDVDCILTLHLAYSPSLESIDALSGTALPIVILDATMDARFGTDVAPERIMYNHGIHGVMDMACMLRRRGKVFQIVAGHVGDSTVMERAAAIVRAARAARCMREAKVLRISESFKGMGDFAVSPDILKEVLGVSVERVGIAELAEKVNQITEDDVAREMDLDREQFICDLPEEIHKRSLRVCLGVRRLLEAGAYSAFSMNFLAFSRGEGSVDTVPFLEASKGMARGMGYAGEGDVLTAALVGALAQGFGETTFTEIFCPDWEGNSLFLSHMGEINPELAADKPRLVEYPFPYTPAQNPAKLACCIKPGPATFVNIVPGPNDAFSLIIAPVEILGDTSVDDMKDSIRGWMRPSLPVGDFLEEYSRHGGTHHSVLVAGHRVEAMEAFAAFMALPCNIISV